ncbi:MAG: putative porin [Bacteroidales bacterium]|nr:putative porin [Bacteroidales bacterium]
MILSKVRKGVVVVLLMALFVVVSLYGHGHNSALTNSNTIIRDTVSTARDTILPNRDTIPFVRDTISTAQDSIPAIVDSTALASKQPAADSIAIPSDTLTYPYGIMEIDTVNFWKQIDTLTIPYLDSTYTAYFDSLALHLPDAKDIKRAERRNAREYRDSVRLATPRILDTYVIPDSLHYQRMLTWTHEQNFNDITLTEIDTSFQYRFNDYPFLRNDVNGTYLGTIGSAMQYHNYFKREKLDLFPQFEPYLAYFHTPENIPHYNTKSAYTELAYWGTPFATKQLEESCVKILTTQNITPALNLSFLYRQYGSRGMLKNEATNNRSYAIGINYLGKKYLLNAGFISQAVIRSENGGLQDSFWVRDTIVDAKSIEVNLQDANNLLKRRTAYLTHSYTIPMNFFRKKDSLDVGEGTVAYIGHSLEYSRYSKVYTDNITENDEYGRNFYFNQFYLNKISSRDSLGTERFENKAFIRLQPFAHDAVISKLDVGVGYQMLSIYSFDPSHYLSGNISERQNNLYLYAGVSGQYRKYLSWSADGKYTFAGYNLNDLDIGGKIKLSFYPIDEGIHLTGSLRTTLTEPHPFHQKIYTNHHKWHNDFQKISDSRVKASLDIPKWQTHAGFNYALVSGLIYYDTLSIIRQIDKPVSIISASLEQNIRLWILHLDNRALFQLSSDGEALPLPKLSLNLKYYIEFNVVKDVMRMQIGLNALFHTKYYVQSYSPDLGVFHNQHKELIGGTPYFDAFVNMQWKNVTLFLKYTNTFKGWPQADYFSAYNYLRPERGFKLGIWWPFYIR